MSYMLSHTSDFNSYATRNASNNDLYVPMPRVEMFRQSFQYAGPVFYNNLPQEVKDSQSLSSFKVKLKNHLMS